MGLETKIISPIKLEVYLLERTEDEKNNSILARCKMTLEAVPGMCWVRCYKKTGKC